MPEGKKRKRGQNKGRKFNYREDNPLCPSLILNNECLQKDNCKYLHDLELYLKNKEPDIDSKCPIYEKYGNCNAGWKCRFLSGHLEELKKGKPIEKSDAHRGIYSLDPNKLNEIQKDELPYKKSEEVLACIDEIKELRVKAADPNRDEKHVYRASFTDAKLRAPEKRQIDWKDRLILCPLTTNGNIPFRRICKSFGCDTTLSEMAVSLPLIRGNRSEWALARYHNQERMPMTDIYPSAKKPHSLFGYQITSAKPWQAVKACELLVDYAPPVDFIDLNCGCPIDNIFNAGAGSALLSNPGRLLSTLQGMERITGDIPITCKIRIGIQNSKLTAANMVSRLSTETTISCVFIHGRTRQQRYSQNADWDYIKQCAEVAHSVAEERTDCKRLQVVGNGDVYTWQDWYDRIENYNVDSCMIGRAALYKPWIFEEINEKRTIDKLSSERMQIMKDFVTFGIETWGSDSQGIEMTRRYLLEYMSFAHRYVPSGLWEDQSLNKRSVDTLLYRDDTEKLLSSTNVQDWIKLSETFLGKPAANFHFVPKQKTNE